MVETVQSNLDTELSLVDIVQLEMEADYQVQVQAKNVHDWGKVSEQFSFRTSTAGRLVVQSYYQRYSALDISMQLQGILPMGLYFRLNIPDVVTVALLLNV